MSETLVTEEGQKKGGFFSWLNQLAQAVDTDEADIVWEQLKVAKVRIASLEARLAALEGK